MVRNLCRARRVGKGRPARRARHDSTLDAAIFIGYHAATTNPEGVRAHTISSAIGFHSAATMTPAAAQDRIREPTTTALRRSDDFRPYVIETPVRLDMTFRSDRPAEMLAYLSVVERTTAHGIRFIGRDMPGVSRFIEFVTGHSISLEP